MSVLDRSVVLEVSRDDCLVLRHYATKLRNFGLAITQNDDEDEETDDELFYVDMAPTCFLQREASEKYFNRESPLVYLLTDLAKELAQTLKETQGGLRLLPNTIANVLKSQACRGKLNTKVGSTNRPVTLQTII